MRAVDEQILLDDICRIVCEEAGYRTAWVGFAEHDEAKSVRPVASAGFDDGYLEFLKITWADTDWGRGAVGTAIRTGRTVCLQNYATDPVCIPWRAEALRRGYLSGVALPLKDESGVVFGTLNMYSPEPDAFTSEEVRLLEELAGDLAFGIRVLRTRAERKHIYRRLQANLRFFEYMDQINLAIQETNDLEQMMSQVLDVTLSIFECDRAWLVYPCDPESATWRVPMERTRPEYSGAAGGGVDFPMFPENIEMMAAVLNSRGPVSFDPGSERAVPEGLTRPEFNIQSALGMAI
jgi:putative methionine-R-sulfoxide reductase with GAF domain